MNRGGAAIMIGGGWECMAARELAIQRLGGKFWGGRFFEVGRRELQEEVRVKRACCEGGRGQIELGDSKNV